MLARQFTRSVPDSHSSQKKAITEPLLSVAEHVVKMSQSVEPVSAGDPDATSVEGGIPQWYIQPRSEDWALSVLGEVPPSDIDDVPVDRSLDPLVETWKLDDNQLLQFQECESVIVKESWLTDGHLNEGVMFKCVENQFGVPRVLCNRVFTQVNSHQVTFWNVWKTPITPSTLTKPEQRCLSRTLYLTEGYDICQVNSPRKLLEVLLHAMLGPSCHCCLSDCCSWISICVGHWVLFKAGWLHRDVSVSNIMAIVEEIHPAVTEYVMLESSLDCVLTANAALTCRRISQSAQA